MVEPGQILDGRYRIIRLIGEGGMGAVFEGENTSIHRRVAIKVLHPSATGNADAVIRFEREAQAAGRIGSDHILEVLDLGKLPDGERYMVMEFLDGEPLTNRIRGLGKMTVEQIVPIAHQILVGLGAAHAAGIVHRDLKPDNIFVLREKAGLRDFVKLIDFGISKFNRLTGDMSMTRTGAVMGTPYYMAPEQAKGSAEVDHRSDLYAIGVILYEAATGQVPFNATTFNELLFKIVLSNPQPLAEAVPNIDPQFAALVEKAMARDPADRFASCGEMISALAALVPAGKNPTAAPILSSTLQPTQVNPSFGLPPVVNAVTQGGFSASQSGQPGTSAPPKRKTAVGLIAAAAVLLLVGGAFATYKVVSGGSDAAVAASSAPLESPKAPIKPAPLVEDVAKPADVASPSAVTAPSATPSANEAQPPKPTPNAGAPRPAVAPRPRPGTPAPAPVPATGTTPKRRDFGY